MIENTVLLARVFLAPAGKGGWHVVIDIVGFDNSSREAVVSWHRWRWRARQAARAMRYGGYPSARVEPAP